MLLPSIPPTHILLDLGSHIDDACTTTTDGDRESERRLAKSIQCLGWSMISHRLDHAILMMLTTRRKRLENRAPRS